ncbi:MAG: response regulator transcription factor [Gallionellaceae bacterium]|nr:response regulator transcription factor [Gallionellaceae bacterium]
MKYVDMLHCASQERRVLIVENHSLVALAIASLLSKIDGGISATICGCAQTAREEFSRSDAWFRIFVDLDIPKAYGLSLARYFAQQGAYGHCVILTGSNNPQWIAAAKSMGLLGYIVKTTPIPDFLDALQSVVDGHPVFPHAPCNQEPQTSIRLTRRQHDVLFLLQRGYSSKKIATQLKLSVGTVDNHVTGLMRTLNVFNRTHAVTKAMELGYITLQDIPQYCMSDA